MTRPVDDAPQVEPSQARRAITILGIVWALGCLCVATMNYLVNPMTYYSPRILPPMVDSARQFKTRQMKALGYTPRIMTLGSSRSMGVSPARIERNSGVLTYNAACDGSKAEDYLALTRFAVEDCGWKLDEVVVGVDLDAFHTTLPPHVELVGARALRPYLEPELTPPWWTPASALLAWDQSVYSIGILKFAATQFPPKVREIDDHGWETHPGMDAEDDRKRKEGTYAPKVEIDLEVWTDRYRKFGSLHPARRAAFVKLAAYAAQKKFRLRVYLTPLHSSITDHLDKGEHFPRVRADALALLEELKRTTPGMEYVDYTDVRAFKGDPENYYPDGNHIQHENLEALVDALWPPRPRAQGRPDVH